MLPDRLPTIPPIPHLSVRNDISPGGGGADGSGGYVFSPEEVDEVIKQWQELLDGLEVDRKEARVVASVRGPGAEFASSDFEQAARPSGRMLYEQTQRMCEYVAKYIQALKDARDATVTRDQEAREHVGDTGDGMLS